MMKTNAKRAIAAAVTLSVTFALAVPATADVGVTVNGDAVDFTPPPIVQAGRVFVPLRGVFERLGASVVYDDGTINATGSGRDISLHIGSTQATVNGQAQIIDVAPFIVGASTYVPLRFISEALGASVNYDDSDQQVAITTAGAPQSYQAPATDTLDTDGTYASYAPPPIPSYAQPDDEVPNDVWQPGYWAWGPYGYYWVPGTWVAAPQPGYLWTPGYWSAENASYGWHPGFWAIVVGFYGGVNYGGGYFGHGYDGGRWNHDTFVYNTYVTHVNTRIVRNVYVDRTVVVRTSGSRVSYNGGSNGVHAQPTAQEASVARARHLGVTPAQRQHVLVAEQDRRLLATVNHDTPPVTAVARPLSASNRPAGFEAVKPVSHAAVHKAPVAATRVAPQAHAAAAPARVVAPVHVEAKAPLAAPVHAAASVRRLAAPPRAAVPVYRPVAAADRAPVVHARAIVQPARVIPPPPHVAAYRAPAAPAHRPAPMRPAPAARAPVAQPRPAQRPAPPHGDRR